MRINELIELLKEIKDEHGDLIVVSENWSLQGVATHSKDNIKPIFIARPQGRVKLYKDTYGCSEDIKVLRISRGNINDVETTDIK